MAGAEVDYLLELRVNPFGEVSHAAVDAADYGACGPGGLVHLWGAVELGDTSRFLEAACEVDCFCSAEVLLVSLDEQVHCPFC